MRAIKNFTHSRTEVFGFPTSFLHTRRGPPPQLPNFMADKQYYQGAYFMADKQYYQGAPAVGQDQFYQESDQYYQGDNS